MVVGESREARIPSAFVNLNCLNRVLFVSIPSSFAFPTHLEVAEETASTYWHLSPKQTKPLVQNNWKMELFNLSSYITMQDRCRIVALTQALQWNQGDREETCPPDWDGILCWPESTAGSEVSLVCPARLDGVPIRNNYNATRNCLPNGTWEDYVNYTGCSPEQSDPLEFHYHVMYYIYWLGYSVSVVFLLVALAIFLHYRSLWCLRNIIHTNLILCFTLHNLTWIGYSLIGHEIFAKKLQKGLHDLCVIPTTILKYLIAAGFFWMFVEGFYLFVSILFSLHAQRIRFWMCALVGWGVPFLLVSITSIIKAHHDVYENCWNESYHLDYIFIGPVLILLLVNFLFLFVIMWVVVTKLQLTVRTERERYKKAVKALLLLCPLLGINYVLVLVQPSHPLWLKLLFSYYITIMTSTQGLLVALFFCFRNNEVIQCVRGTARIWMNQWELRRKSTVTFYAALPLRPSSQL